MTDTIQLPTPGEKNRYEFLPPYDSLTLHWNEYECIGIRKMSDMIKSNEAVWKELYEAYDLQYDRYLEDMSDDVFVIEIKAVSGLRAKVPLSFIKSISADYSVPYKHYALSLNIGLLPTNTDLTVLKSELEGIVKDVLGKESISEVMTLSDDVNLTLEQNKVEIAKRKLLKDNQPSYRAKYITLLEQFNILQEQYYAMERYLTVCMSCSSCGNEENLTIPDRPNTTLREDLPTTIRFTQMGQCLGYNKTLNKGPYLFHQDFYRGPCGFVSLTHRGES